MMIHIVKLYQNASWEKATLFVRANSQEEAVTKAKDWFNNLDGVIKGAPIDSNVITIADDIDVVCIE